VAAVVGLAAALAVLLLVPVSVVADDVVAHAGDHPLLRWLDRPLLLQLWLQVRGARRHRAA
jgi:hypothetical protein